MAKYRVILLVGILALMLGVYNVSAKEFIVGDVEGWRVPNSPTTYSDWSSQQKFSPGDVLVFNFESPLHTVALVNGEAFQTCNTSNPIFFISDGPARVTIQEIGSLHFICTVGDGGHCMNGQKVAINVTDDSSPSPLLPPAPSPSPAPLPSPPTSSSSPNSIVTSSSLALFLSLLLGLFIH